MDEFWRGTSSKGPRTASSLENPFGMRRKTPAHEGWFLFFDPRSREASPLVYHNDYEPYKGYWIEKQEQGDIHIKICDFNLH